jgi:pimeloyl-ACP methyl ester carboxylesterase
MAWPNTDVAAALTRVWLGECASITRAVAAAATELLGDIGILGSRPSLHWERTGSGPAVLLITGLGLSGGSWWRTVPVLAKQHEVITFDNRGVGRSDAVFHAYSTTTMADDAVSVLDAAGIDSAHVYGISLGGMVAQQIALRHPGRVTSLVLGATSPGGRHASDPDREVLEFLRQRAGMRHEAAAWKSVRFNYSERCRTEHPERIAEDVAQRLGNGFTAQAYRAQMWAAGTHDAYRELPQITARTLVVHGCEDRMIPIDNGRLIASRIPGARMLELPRTGHLYPTEVPGIDAQISEFMSQHSKRRSSKAN